MLVYNPILYYLFFALIVPALNIGSSFSWLLRPFDIPPVIVKVVVVVCFVVLSYFLALHFLAPVLESAISPRSADSFYWRWY